MRSISYFKLLASTLMTVSLGACSSSAPTASDSTAAEQAGTDLSLGTPAFVLEWGEDGRLAIPAFGTDISKYDSLVFQEGDVVAVRSQRAGKMEIHFDGPPLLVPEHELHIIVSDSELAQGSEIRFQVSQREAASGGAFHFLCPNANGDSARCPGILLPVEEGSQEWVPQIRAQEPVHHCTGGRVFSGGQCVCHKIVPCDDV